MCVCWGGGRGVGGGMVGDYCPEPGWAYYSFISGESVCGSGNK